MMERVTSILGYVSCDTFVKALGSGIVTNFRSNTSISVIVRLFHKVGRIAVYQTEGSDSKYKFIIGSCYFDFECNDIFSIIGK